MLLYQGYFNVEHSKIFKSLHFSSDISLTFGFVQFAFIDRVLIFIHTIIPHKKIYSSLLMVIESSI